MAARAFFLGDSFTAGQGDPAGGWVPTVAAAARDLDPALQVVNLGVGGATSAAIAAHWEAAVTRRLGRGEEARLVLGVGANDTTAMGAGATWVDPAASLRNLEQILDRARQLGMPVFVLGPGPASLPAQDARSAALEAAFAGSCAARGVPFVAILAPLLRDAQWAAECAAGDGLHPAAGGYARLAELVLAGGLAEWLAG